MTRKQLNILAWVILILAAGAAFADERSLVWAFMAAYLVIFAIRITGWFIKKEEE